MAMNKQKGFYIK